MASPSAPSRARAIGNEHFVLTTDVGPEQIDDLECHSRNPCSVFPIKRRDEVRFQPPEDLVLLEERAQRGVLTEHREKRPLFIFIVLPHRAAQ